MNKELIILIGNIGAGKSTLVKEYVKKGYVVVCKDAIRYMLGGGSYLFDLELEDLVEALSLKALMELMILGKNIVLDETHMSRASRQAPILLSKAWYYNAKAVVLPKISKEESVKRRLGANHGTTPKEIWEQVWDRKNSEYEEPSEAEGFTEVIKHG